MEEAERRYLLREVTEDQLEDFEQIESSLGYFSAKLRVRVHRSPQNGLTCFLETKEPPFGLVRTKTSLPIEPSEAPELLRLANWTLSRRLYLSKSEGRLLTLEELTTNEWLMEVEGGDLQLPSGFVGVDVTEEQKYYSYSRARAAE